jgi:ATP adenylyltransferase
MTAAFDDLYRFISTEMRMSHIYQPVMISALLRHDGRASVQDIAAALLARDQAQLDYYKQITRQMPGSVLRKRGIVEVLKDVYSLPHFSELTDEECSRLVAFCDAKVEAYLEKRSDPWSHRRRSVGYISGSLRYEVLKRAAFRCELCGASAKDRALEVDHIAPRNRGGADDPFNLQALCYSCNAMKRDRDDTDFRGIAEMYEAREPGCPFCDVVSNRVVSENALMVAMRDAYPVTAGHTLILPKRHVQSGSGLTQPEINALWALHTTVRVALMEEDHAISGFNFGLNDGAVAGQTVAHCHFHLIPRRAGDMPDPRGGVRGVIPDRQKY